MTTLGLLLALLGCKPSEDTAPVDTGEPEWCELDLDSPWSFNKVLLPFEAMSPRVAVVADRLVLAGGDHVHTLDDGIYVGIEGASGLLESWEVLATLPEGTMTFERHALPSSPSRVVLYGGATREGVKQDFLWASYDGETLSPWHIDDNMAEPVYDTVGIFTQDDRLLILGGGLADSTEYAGGWTTTFTDEGPSTWEPISTFGKLEPGSLAANRGTIHLGGRFMDSEIFTGSGYLSARLVDGLPVEWEEGRTPASAGVAGFAVAEGHLFTGPSSYRYGQSLVSGVLYTDANDPFDWYHLPDLPLELGGGTMVAHKGYLYIMGGVDGGNNRIDHIFHRPICVDGSGG